jgi:amino acid adenylation domain-containing protein
VHLCFESWARRQPDAFALIYATASEPSGVRSLRYQELNRRANQLARYLKRSGLKREGLVGICTERSFEMVVAMLATLKAGGAFVPLDPAYPRERLSYMVEDANIQILLAQEQLPELVAASRCVRLDSDWPIIDMEDDSNPEIGCVPTQLAYVIYTSGSTGRPKGTMLTHHGLCNLAAEQERSFAIRPGSKVLQFSSLSFDASVWEFVMALLNGATLCLTSRDTVSSGHDLVDLMGRLGISTVTLPPSVLAVLPQVELPGLRTLITAGEKCTGDLVMRWGGGRDFFNAYGPTETTVCASMHRCKGSDSQGPPIGRPIQNFDLYILDPNLQPVPVGVPGELYIGGVGLARGYLFRPDLTAERFIPHPFAKKRGARLYKSGDVCRFLQDGNIEMLGRADLQVKVRGFRIELGEIETVLSEYPGVRDVAVVARELTAGEKQLIAYLVAHEGGAPAVVDLRSYLRQRLPEYMVPAVYMILTAMPLTPSKKIDRHALPAPDRDRMGNDKPFIAPGTDTEIRLAAIASQLLNISSVGASDNFFDLGGHSLMATQFISRVYEEFSVEMALRILFEKPTIAEFAREVEKMRTSAGTSQRPKIKAIARESVRVKQSELT